MPGRMVLAGDRKPLSIGVLECPQVTEDDSPRVSDPKDSKVKVPISFTIEALESHMLSLPHPVH